MEIMDLYDRDRQKLNETMVRGDVFKNGRFHMVVHVCVFNQYGQMLIQKRKHDKSRWPGLWDLSVGGSAVEGDDSKSAAERETLEEIGIVIDLSDTRPYVTVNFENGFDDYYLIEKDIDLDEIEMPTIEVEHVKWADCSEILRMIQDESFIQYKKYFIEMLFEMRHGYGSIYDEEGKS